MLKVESLRVHYGGLVALDGVSLEAARGGVTAVVGANGAGKTTLLKAISGTVPIQDGAILDGQVDISGLAAHRRARRGISHVPEGRRVFASMSVRDNLLAGASHAGPDSIGIDGVLALFPLLKPHVRRAAGQLSGGQQQMLAIGRALMAGPRVLLLDEPSTGLAPAVVSEVFSAVARMISVMNCTIILVEQRAIEAFDVASLAYVLERGRVVASGEPRELRRSEKLRKAYLSV